MYLLLVNPKAGNNRYRQIERSLRQVLDRYQTKYNIVAISDLSEIADLLSQHVKPQTKAVVAVGGHGTVARIIDALVDYDLPLGIIPVSRTNHLANTLGIRSWQAGVKLLTNHEIINKRLGKIGQHYFIESLMIAPRRNLLSGAFGHKSWLKKFLGTNIARGLKGSHSVACELKLDNELAIKCQAHHLTVTLDNDTKKKMKIRIDTADDKPSVPSIFRANRLSITSSLNMPIISGNETIANTPITITAVGKTIPVIQPINSKVV